MVVVAQSCMNSRGEKDSSNPYNWGLHMNWEIRVQLNIWFSHTNWEIRVLLIHCLILKVHFWHFFNGAVPFLEKIQSNLNTFPLASVVSSILCPVTGPSCDPICKCSYMSTLVENEIIIDRDSKWVPYWKLFGRGKRMLKIFFSRFGILLPGFVLTRNCNQAAHCFVDGIVFTWSILLNRDVRERKLHFLQLSHMPVSAFA